jgi:hypothetical protein
MIEKCSIGKMSNSLQNISLIILILILIIVILFYIRNSGLKHNELIEKYTTTGFLNQTPDISYSGSLTATNNTSMFPSQGTVVTLRTCQVNFNNDGTSKYEYQDEWKEIRKIDGEANEIPVKTIGYDNTTNVDAFGHNFSERSRCFKELDQTNTETYKYKYLDNNLIQYDRNNYVSLTSNINGADVTKKYMEMKFNILGSSYENLFNNTSNSICSLNYSTSLSGTDLGNVKLYRLKLTTDNKIENIEKININPTNNHIFTNVADIDLNSLLTTTNTSSYVYENGKFIFRVISNVTGGTAGGVNNINVNIYNFDRELFCNKDQEGVTYNNIKSYKIFSNKQLDVNKLISASSANTDTNIPDTIFPNANTTSYDKKTSVLSHIKEVLNTQIDSANSPALTAETTAQKNIEEAEQRRDSFVSSINTKSKFIYKILTETDATILRNLNRNNFITLDKLSYSSKNITDQENLIDSVSEPVFSQNEQDIYTVESFSDTTKPYTKDFTKKTICDILIVGGGGGGGASIGSGGGAGGLISATSISISAGSYNIIVGKGGACAVNYLARGANGNNSSAFGYTAYGGGGGAGQSWVYNQTGTASGTLQTTSTNQGSGAGGTRYKTIGNVGTTGQGYNGGNSFDHPSYASGGGGGAGGVGGNGSSTKGGDGGVGLEVNITGTNVYYAGGGGGISDDDNISTTNGIGGLGGGGNGSTSGNGFNGTNGLGGGGGGGGTSGSGGNGGSGIVIIKFKTIVNAAILEGVTHKRLNFGPSIIKYDFTNYNTEATWKEYAATIPNFTYFINNWFNPNFFPNSIYGGDYAVGFIQITLPGEYNNVSVFYGNGGWNGTNNETYVRLLINGVEKSSTLTTTTYSQSYTTGDILRIEETYATLTSDIIITLTNTNKQYTLNFPVRTLVDVNNNSNLILQGNYNVNVGHPKSSLLPDITNTTNRLIPLPTTNTSNISVRYHTLNPVKTAEGAQWTYSSSNANVYHLGSVGIGTASPEYSLDVRGFIYSSSGGYTSSALTKWSVLSDRRIKENIVKASYDKCLENVKNIELYNFNFKDNYVNTNDRHQLGFIAQEVQQIYPKAVEVSRMIMNLEEKIDDLLTLNTTQIDYTLYGAVKCLIQKLENIKIKMEQIKTVYNITT